MKLLARLFLTVLFCLNANFSLAQNDNEPAYKLTLDQNVATGIEVEDVSTTAFSFEELDALIDEDNQLLPVLGRSEISDLLALIAFLCLALASFLRKSTKLKYATMVVAIFYMGFFKANLVSMVHIFGLLEWSLPLFRYNISWYLLMIFTIVSTVLWGRLYCGRICAFGAFTQLMDRITPSKFRLEFPKRIERRAIYVKYALLLAVTGYFVLTKDKFIYKYFEPFWMFTFNGTAVMWTLLALLLLTTIFVRNFYCRYLCLVGAALGLISKLTIFGINRWKQCDTCKICENACEWGAIEGPIISVTECVRCDDCEILYNDEEKCPHWLMLKKVESKYEETRYK